MFFGFASAKVLAAICTPIVIGFMLLPAHTMFLWVGGLTVLGGIFLTFSAPWYGVSAIAVGFVMVMIGRTIERGLERESEAAAEETQARIRRMMSVNLPTEDDS